VKIQGESQVLGQPIRDSDGRRFGRIMAVDCSPEDPYTAALFMLRLRGLRRRLRAVPAQQARWHAAGGLQVPLRRWVLVCAAVGACLGAQTGYWIGRRVGPPLFDRSTRARLRDGRDRAEHYLARYGHGKAIVLARFVPDVRTVLNPLAGIVGVPQKTSAFWQAAGGLVWSVGVVLAGYALGSHIKNVDHYLLPLIAVIIIASLIPIGVELLHARRASRGTA
jgi:membrane-associated protein